MISSWVTHWLRKTSLGERMANDCSGTFEFGWTRSARRPRLSQGITAPTTSAPNLSFITPSASGSSLDTQFIIEKAELDGDLAVGQGLQIADQSWTITALGAVAQTNLANLGHVTLVFDGAVEPRMPGAVHAGGVDATPALAVGAAVVFGV